MTANILPPVLIERLGKDHARIAAVVRELAELTEALDQVLDWQRLSELVEFLDYYADQVHHPLEDRLFDRLMNKGLTPTERHLVFRNLGQHQEIRALTEALTTQIDLAKARRSLRFSRIRDFSFNFLSRKFGHCDCTSILARDSITSDLRIQSGLGV